MNCGDAREPQRDCPVGKLLAQITRELRFGNARSQNKEIDMTTYTSEFAIDDEVWMVRSESFRKMVECFPCDNTGRIEIKGDSLICPKCDGQGKHEKYVGQRLYVADHGKIGQVRLTDCPSEDGFTVEYMIDSTGIGSGQIWKERELFRTRELAEQHCEQENSHLMELA